LSNLSFRFTADTRRAGVAPVDRDAALVADRAPEPESPARNRHGRLIEMLRDVDRSAQPWLETQSLIGGLSMRDRAPKA